MLPLLLPLALLALAMAAGAALDVRRGARWTLAAPGAVGATLVAYGGFVALRGAWHASFGVLSPGGNLVLVASAALLVALPALAVRALPPRPPFLLAALLPLLALPFGARVLLPGGESLWAGAAFAALAAGTWPWALAHGARGTRLAQAGAVALGILLFAGSAGGAVMLLVDATDGGAAAPAVHAWALDVEPSDAQAAWTLEAPFFVAAEPRGAAALQALAATLRVVEGDASVRLRDDGAVEVRGAGPVRVEATHSFYGAGAEREAFHAWRVSGTMLLVTGVPTAEVRWVADFSGGSGHTCWARAIVTETLREGEPAPLMGDGIRGDGRVQAACA